MKDKQRYESNTTLFLYIVTIMLSFRWLLVMLNQHPGCAIKIPLLSNQEPTSDRCYLSFKVKVIKCFFLSVVSQWQVPLYGKRWQGNCSQHYNQVLLWLLPPFPFSLGLAFSHLSTVNLFKLYVVHLSHLLIISNPARKVTITGFDLKSYRQCLQKWNAAITAMNEQCDQLGNGQHKKRRELKGIHWSGLWS